MVAESENRDAFKVKFLINEIWEGIYPPNANNAAARDLNYF